MVQLVVNGTTYPIINEKRYRAYPATTKVHQRMANGRLTTQNGYRYWRIEAGPYDYIENATKETMLEQLESNESLSVAFLPHNRDTMDTGIFKCVDLTRPVYDHSKDGTSFWTGLSFVLEGVEAID